MARQFGRWIAGLLAAVISGVLVWYITGPSSEEVRNARQPWLHSWTCELDFDRGGTATLRMDAANAGLEIASWSLEMDTPFDTLIYRSSSPRTGFAGWL